MSGRFGFRLAKFTFALSLIAFVAIQLHMRLSSNDKPAVQTAENTQLPSQPRQSVNGLSPPPHSSKDGKSNEESVISIDEVKKWIDFNNAHNNVLNEDKFGPVSQASLVTVVQVHNRSKYLSLLIKSLGAATDIDKTLLVFSHDFFSAEINELIRQITFCRVIQIFYPYSIQLFPDRFPGHDPDDCSPNMSKQEAETKKCKNWQNPDKYGHYRVAALTQIKHHWWWKMNYVFDGIAQLADYDGYVVLLEEDHYISPDFIQVLNFIIKNKNELCQNCQIVALGHYLKQYGSYAENIDRLAVYPWFSSRHNMGMAFNRDTWTRIKNCSSLFCTYDDYNWDWSLMYTVSQPQCFKDRLHVIYTKAPRVFHIGDCGVHSHKCDDDSTAKKVAQILASVKDKLFPKTLQVTERSKRMLKASKENGGWGDIRDHELCKSVVFGRSNTKS